MGTISEQIIVKLKSLLTKVDESHQKLLTELTSCKGQLEYIQKINIQLEKLEEKVDYIQSFPKEKEEKLTKLVERLTKEKEKQVLLPKAIEKSGKPNVFKPLERPLDTNSSMPDFEQSPGLTKLALKILKF